MCTDLKLLLMMLLSPVVFCGCLQGKYYEEVPLIAVSEESVTAEAAVRDGYDIIADTLTVTSNRSWGLNVTDAQGNVADWVKVSVEDNMNLSGMTQDTRVILTFDPNWTTSAREASLVITSAECERTVQITQAGASHNLAIDKEQTQTSFGPRDSQARIHFRTNSNWSASVAEGATIRDVVLSKSSGNDQDTYLDVTFGLPYASGEKHASIVFDVEGMDHLVSVDLVQTGVVIELSFDDQPFTVKLPESSTPIESTDYTYQWYGSDYNIQIGKNKIQYRSADKCLLLDGKGFVRLPSVEDFSLAEVRLKSVATNKKFTISSDEAGKNALDGGEVKTLPMDAEGVWELTGTQTGTSYYIYASGTKSRIASLYLIYE